MPRRILTVVLLLAGACGGPAQVTPPETTFSEPTTTTSTTTTAPPEAAAPCLEGAFAETGVIGVIGDDEGDATRLASLRWAAHPGCERVAVDLTTEGGAPATRTGPVEVEVRRDLGLVRLSLPETVTATTVADATFEGDLARRAYVVRRPDGSLFLDVHLGEASLIRAFTLSSPARVVVDLRPGGVPLPPPPSTAERVVLLTPRSADLSYPLEITGYARTFEATVVVRIRKDDVVEVEELATAADYVETWGAFSLTVEDGPPPPVTLFVGEDSPRDGSEEGVELELSE